MNADEIVRVLYLCAAGGQTTLQTSEWCTIAADLIESLQVDLADYHHMSKVVDGKMKENQRLRRINENLQERLAESQRREKAAVEERDTMMRRYSMQVEAIRRRVDAGDLTAAEQRLLDDLMLPRHYDRRVSREVGEVKT